MTKKLKPKASSVVVLDSRPLKLDLAAGQNPRAGFTGVDLFTGDNRVDLLRFPWPWADGSVDEVVCSHFVEHIPMGFVDADNVVHPLPGVGRKEMFFAFFDEIHRVLKPGGKAEIIVPYLQHQRAFQDPTHRRFICEASFSYLMKPWRDGNRLDHYNVKCDFAADACIPVTDASEAARHPEVQAARRTHQWNVVGDIIVHLRKL